MCQAGVIASSRLIGARLSSSPTVPTSLDGLDSATGQDLQRAELGLNRNAFDFFDQLIVSDRRLPDDITATS
jgi:hypothetical protein